MNRYKVTYIRGAEVESDYITATFFEYELGDNLVVYFYEKKDTISVIVAVFNYVISIELLRKRKETT